MRTHKQTKSKAIVFELSLRSLHFFAKKDSLLFTKWLIKQHHLWYLQRFTLECIDCHAIKSLTYIIQKKASSLQDKNLLFYAISRQVPFPILIPLLVFVNDIIINNNTVLHLCVSKFKLPLSYIRFLLSHGAKVWNANETFCTQVERLEIMKLLQLKDWDPSLLSLSQNSIASVSRSPFKNQNMWVFALVYEKNIPNIFREVNKFFIQDITNMIVCFLTCDYSNPFLC
jgi:hypothetical protein